MTPSDRYPRIIEITDKVTSLGGRQVVQEEGDCWGLYLREKKERKDGLVRLNKRYAYGVEGSQVVEDGRRYGGICVDDGMNTE